jgi:GT2 family glycosyltransferase
MMTQNTVQSSTNAHIDSISPNLLISGWAVDSSDYDKSVRVAIYAGNALLAICTANQYRSDLDQMVGSGEHGFSAKLLFLPRSVDGAAATLQIRLVDLDSKANIAHNQYVCDFDAQKLPPGSVSNVGHFKELFDRIDASVLFDEAYLANECGQEFASRGEALLRYLSDCSLWEYRPSVWVDVDYLCAVAEMGEQIGINPLVWYFAQDQDADVGPNPLFSNHDYRIACAGDEALLEDESSPSEFDRWFNPNDTPALIEPSILVDLSYFAKNLGLKKNCSNHKLLEEMVVWLETAPGERNVSVLHPCFEQEWLQSHRILRQISSKKCMLTWFKCGLLPGLAPCAILQDKDIKQNYYLDLKNYELMFKFYGQDDLSKVSNRIDLKLFQQSVAKLKVADSDQTRSLLSRYMTAKHNVELPVFLKDVDPVFITNEYAGLVNFVFKRNGIKDINYICARWLDLLCLPKNYHDVALDKPAMVSLNDLDKMRAIAAPSGAVRASVLIPTYARDDLTLKCLISILVSTGLEDVEFLVAEDAAHIDGGWILQYFCPFIKLIKSEVNKGFLRNCNDAAKSAIGKILVLVNNDVIASRNALNQLLDTFERDEKIAVVGGLILNADGSVQENGGMLWRDASAWNYNRGWSPRDLLAQNFRDVDYVSGCWIGIKKSVWDEVGGFDSRYEPAYCEESDFCLTAWQRGYRVCINPASVITHLDGATMGTDEKSNSLKAYQVINRKKLLAKWRHLLAADFNVNGNPSPFHTGRSFKNKSISVVFDHYIPEPDRDAGSRTLFSICQTLAKIENNYVIFVPANNHRSEYAAQLEALGIEIILGDAGWNRFDDLIKNHSHFINFALVSRYDIAKKFEWQISQLNCKMALYIHDLDTLRKIPWGSGNARAEGFIKQAMTVHMANYHKIYARFDSILSCSEEETEMMRPYLGGKMVNIFPYDNKFKSMANPEGNRNDLIFVGSYNHTPNREGLRQFLETQWLTLSNRLPGARLHIVGSGFERDLAFAMKNVVVHGFVSDRTLNYLYSISRVSLAPLLSGAGVKGKVIESCAHGVPCVGTEVAYRGIDLAGQHAFCSGDMASMSDRVVLAHQAFNQDLSQQLIQMYQRLTSKNSIEEVINRLFLSASSELQPY